MAQLNITLNQEEILQLLSKDHDQAFRELLRKSLNSILMESQIDRIRPAFRLTQGRKETFFPDSFKLRHILLSNYLVEVATLVSDDAEDDEDDAAEVEASDDAFFFALSRLSFSKSLLSTSGASVS